MILTCLSVSGFRNLAEQHLQFFPHVNIISGPNGQGKILLTFAPSKNYAAVKAIEIVDEL